ncbi:Hsp70 suppressor, GTPase facilitates ribosomal subunit dissociation [Steccherinum ochraceum]|uniref:Elongation factor 1 alpha-like protein n=1 Tax=Steccherinum ochraceum TaxID=92696 RepID=A0A4R0RSP5_9APHY|nr:Hsp70 suppressor, GTPase facilitates ribosomal subunit dissociation [Steccherinum ochraceum]
MSRHRDVRNMNVHEEMQDDYYSDGAEDDLSPEDYERLMDGMEMVRETIGPVGQSGITEADIKDTLYHYDFDVEHSVAWLLEEQERRFVAQERRGYKPLPPPPGHDDSDVVSPRMTEEGIIRLGPSNPEYIPELDQAESFLGQATSRLSTISEKTERTEDSRDWGPAPETMSVLGMQTASSWTSTTDYGQLIERPQDPNEIPPSPPLSALRRLSVVESPPSASSTGSRTPTMPTRSLPTEVVIPSDSASSPHGSRNSPYPPGDSLLLRQSSSRSSQQAKTPASGKPRSKLSELASSRSSVSSASKSSRSSTTSSASTATYPPLRPSSESIMSFRSDAESSVTGSSSLSSHVRKAIEAALQLEELDAPESEAAPQTQSPPPPDTPKAIPRAIGTAALSGPEEPSLPAEQVAPTSPLSTTSAPPAASPARSGKQPSKLALLAQAKSQSSWMPKAKKPSTTTPGLTLHKSRTEYLTPIANGPTATTAITTTYQTLGNLAKMPKLPPSYPPSAQATSPTSPESRKQSKLALKSRKAQQPQPEPEPEAPPAPELDPIFVVSSPRSRASPSAFASLLVDDVTSQDHKHKERKESKHGKHRDDGEKHRHTKHTPDIPPAPLSPLQGFAFDIPSPDDIVFRARRGTSLAPRTSASTSTHLPPSTSSSRPSSHSSPAKVALEREKAEKLAQQKKAAEASSRAASAPGTPKKSAARLMKSGASTPGTSTPLRGGGPDVRSLDLSALNLTAKESVPEEEPPPKITIAREKVLEEARKMLEGKDEKKGVSLVVIGHVDAGKSTLMGRLLYELGCVDEKSHIANERASSKMGKSSFSWAWELDGTTEERERGITMDVALQSLTTPHRQITILDAPGHKDFIPNMISGASQADCALLVVDAATGEFEAGFERGGQTREHLLLVRSLGVSQVVVAINKLDQVQWQKDRYEDICNQLKPFLVQSGFHPSKTKFAPVGAMGGINLVNREGPDAEPLRKWYKGPTLVDLLDVLEPPTRDIMSPLRFPIANVFKGQSSSIAITGRVCGGLVQVGEKLRVLPGDDTAIVKSIELEDNNVQWAAAGSNVTLYLTSVDPGHVNIGSVLCPPTDLIPLTSTFNARIIVFDIQIPITAGTSVELFHHSRDVPASISKLLCTLDRASGTVIKTSPRVLAKGVSAEVQITLRSTTMSGPAARAQPIPLEPFSANKEMGRVLVRRGGETIAAGIVTQVN